MTEQKLTKFETGSVLVNIFILMTVGFLYCYLIIFLAPENKEIGITFGTGLSLILFYQLGRIFSIFKQKKTHARVDYLVNYPLGVCVVSALFALLTWASVGFSSIETKIFWVFTFVLIAFFNGFLTMKLMKKM